MLFNGAYLSRPFWLAQAESESLSRLEKEGLVRWIPDEYYDHAYNRMAKLAASRTDYYSLAGVRLKYSLDASPNEWRESDTELEVRVSEARQNVVVASKQLAFAEPLVGAGLRHLRYAGHEPLVEFLSPVPVPLLPDFDRPGTMPDWLSVPWARPDCSFLTNLRDSFEREHLEQVLDDLFPEHRDEAEREIHNQALLMDVCVASMAAELFACESLLPIKTAGGRSGWSYDGSLVGDEEYQLLNLQFRELRYPVIETIEDVMRLRDDARLESYRSVIHEYSGRLRSDLERGRKKILLEFQRDLRLASASLPSVHGTQLEKVSIFLALPLMMIAQVTDWRLLGIVSTAGSLLGRYVKARKRRDLDWLMFGAPGAPPK